MTPSRLGAATTQAKRGSSAGEGAAKAAGDAAHDHCLGARASSCSRSAASVAAVEVAEEKKAKAHEVDLRLQHAGRDGLSPKSVGEGNTAEGGWGGIVPWRDRVCVSGGVLGPQRDEKLQEARTLDPRRQGVGSLCQGGGGEPSDEELDFELSDSVGSPSPQRNRRLLGATVAALLSESEGAAVAAERGRECTVTILRHVLDEAVARSADGDPPRAAVERLDRTALPQTMTTAAAAAAQRVRCH